MYTSDSAAATPETLSVIGRFGGKANSGGRGGGDNRLQGMCTTTASHFHTVELLKKQLRPQLFVSVQHGHELQRACHTPSTFVKYTLLPPILRPYNLRHLSTHSGEPVREELRREEALQLGGAPA